MKWDTYGDCDAKGNCVNRMKSIPSAMYFCLVNLFGEYPLADSHSPWGKAICSFVAVVAAIAVGIPAGLLGQGFQDAADEVEEERGDGDDDESGDADADALESGDPSFLGAADADGAAEVLLAPTKSQRGLQAQLFRLLHPDEFLVGDLASVVEAGEEDEEERAGASAAPPRQGRVVRKANGSLALALTGGAGSNGGAPTFVDVPSAHALVHADGAATIYLAGKAVYYFILALILLNIASIVADSIAAVEHSWAKHSLDVFEAVSVAIFTLEYAARFAAVGADARFACVCARGAARDGGGSAAPSAWGRLRWAFTFYALVDIASIVPFYVNLAVTGGIASTSAFVRTFRLLRLLKSPNAVEFLGVFGKTLKEHADVLVVTASFTGVLWILSSALMHYFERDNPDKLMSQYYQDIPSAMWITLLNLSGECPLCDFTVGGKIVTAVIGIFAVGIFGVPVGVFEAGFVDWAATEGLDLDDDDDDEEEEEEGEEEGDGADEGGAAADGAAASLTAVTLRTAAEGETSAPSAPAVSPRQRIFDAINNKGRVGRVATVLIFALIFITIATACLGTVESLQTDAADKTFAVIEGVCTVIFTLEYLARLYVADLDPDLAWCKEQGAPCWFSYVFSFFSIVDLVAIVPWYFEVAGLVPPAMGDYLRMLRLLRLLKLDKYVPSVSLVDDIFRRNQQAFQVTGAVVGIVWIVFATLLYETTHDYEKQFMELTMAQRYTNIPNSLQCVPVPGSPPGSPPRFGFARGRVPALFLPPTADRVRRAVDAAQRAPAHAHRIDRRPLLRPRRRRYAFIHLSGDYPFVDYTGWGRVVNFFIIVIAVAVVGVPIGLISNGFEDIIEEIAEGEEATGGGAFDARINLRTMDVTIHDEAGNVVHRSALDDENTLVSVRDRVTCALGVVASEARAAAAAAAPRPDSSSLQSPDSADDVAALSTSNLLGNGASAVEAVGAWRRFQESIVDFLEGSDEVEKEGGDVRERSGLFVALASAFQTFMLLLILLNVLLVLLETVDVITASAWGPPPPPPPGVFLGVVGGAGRGAPPPPPPPPPTTTPPATQNRRGNWVGLFFTDKRDCLLIPSS
jgi:hypothetical protein